MNMTVKNIDKSVERFKSMAGRLKKPKAVYNSLAGIALKNVDKHFRDEKGTKKPWVKWNRRTKDGREFFSARPTRRGGTKLLQDGGTLKNSIQIKSTQEYGLVYTDLGYAVYHQKGTKNMVKRPFMWIDEKTRSIIVKNLGKYIVGMKTRGS